MKKELKDELVATLKTNTKKILKEAEEILCFKLNNKERENFLTLVAWTTYHLWIKELKTQLTKMLQDRKNIMWSELS